MTLAEAVLASHALEPAEPGAICRVRVDFAYGNDITGPTAIRVFARIGAKAIFNPTRCALIADHFTPNRDIASATQVQRLRQFAKHHGLLFWETGRCGIEHAFLPEQGYFLPGDLIVGADSHACTGGALGAFATGIGSTDLAAVWALGGVWLHIPETIRVEYGNALSPWVGGKDVILDLIGRIGVDGARNKALEFSGEAIDSMAMDDRSTMANMAVEAGAVTGMFVPDATILHYAEARAKRPFTPVYPDAGAHYACHIRIEADRLEPLVALPHLPSNVKPAAACGKYKLDQVFIGSCTNGRLKDMALAAAVLQGRRIHPGLRLIIIPATYQVYAHALDLGYIKTFIDAGAAVSTPTCGPCLGGHMGILAAGERCLATSNRNFVGRMGSKESEILLSGPLVAAAGAVLGRVADPREVMGSDPAPLLNAMKEAAKAEQSERASFGG